MPKFISVNGVWKEVPAEEVIVASTAEPVVPVEAVAEVPAGSVEETSAPEGEAVKEDEPKKEMKSKKKGFFK